MEKSGTEFGIELVKQIIIWLYCFKLLFTKRKGSLLKDKQSLIWLYYCKLLFTKR